MSRNSVTSISTDWGDDPTAETSHVAEGGDGGRDGQYYVYNSGDDDLYEIPSQDPPGRCINSHEEEDSIYEARCVPRSVSRSPSITFKVVQL